MVTAEVIVIGSEFTTGSVRDENARILAEKLTEAGYLVHWISFVGDVQKNIAAALRQAAGRSSLIVTTGGLGIGHDDVTRKAVSQVVHRRLTLNEKLLETLNQGLRRSKDEEGRGYSRKALVPARSRVLTGAGGKIHGFAVHWQDAYVVCLPGKPDEVERLFDEAVSPYLADRFKRRPVTATRTLHTLGLTESEVRERLEDLLHPRAPIAIQVCSRPDGVDIEIRSPGRSEAEAREPLDPIEEKLKERLGAASFGSDGRTLEAAVAGLLVGKGIRLALAESCTGGLISHRLTNIPGSSSYMDRSCVCYSNQSKTDLLGVPLEILKEHGAVSAPVAEAMARGIRQRSGADLGISVTGIAGPAGGSTEKPVGLVFFGMADSDGVRSWSKRFEGRRESIKRKASQEALGLLWRHLCGSL